MINQTMMNIQWQNAKCHICHSKKTPEPIMLHGKPLVDGHFGYAVHPYCYCKETLFRTLEQASLYPYVYGEENEEVWCLVHFNKAVSFELDTVQEKQKKVLGFYLR